MRTFKKTIAILLLSACLAKNAAADGPSMGQMCDYCHSNNASETLACSAYFLGVMETSYSFDTIWEAITKRSTPLYCSPANIKVSDYVAIFKKTCAEQPTERTSPTALFFINEMMKAYPCKK